LAQNAVLCVECGFNLETGRFTKGTGVAVAKEGKKKAEGHEGAAELLLDKAQHSLKEDYLEQIKNRTEGMPIWAIMAALIIIGTIAVSMSLMPRSRAFFVSGCVCIGVCNTIAAVFGLRILIISFRESAVTGLLYLFVPFYSLFYIITRWSKCGRLFLTSLVAVAMSGFGFLMLWMSTIVSDQTEETRLPLETSTYVACRSEPPLGEWS
jgi:hypothetical protein